VPRSREVVPANPGIREPSSIAASVTGRAMVVVAVMRHGRHGAHADREDGEGEDGGRKPPEQDISFSLGAMERAPPADAIEARVTPEAADAVASGTALSQPRADACGSTTWQHAAEAGAGDSITSRRPAG